MTTLANPTLVTQSSQVNASLGNHLRMMANPIISFRKFLPAEFAFMVLLFPKLDFALGMFLERDASTWELVWDHFTPLLLERK